MPPCGPPAAAISSPRPPCAPSWPPPWRRRPTPKTPAPATAKTPASLTSGPGRFVLAVTATAREAEELAAALSSLLPPDTVATFPAWETLPHERLSPRSDTSGQRLAVLRRLAHPDPADPRTGPLLAVAAPVRSLLQPMAGGLGDLEPVSLAPGQEADLEALVTRLVEIGYARAELVEKRGDLAVRGGILDVFPPTEEHPLRVDFFGDEVEEIRYFKVADQRSLEIAAGGLWAPPCRELLLTPGVRARAKQLAAEWPGLGEVLGKLADGITVEGMEAFAPTLCDRMELLLDYVPADGLVVACDPERIRARAADLVSTSQEFLEASWVNAAAGGLVPIDLGGAAFRAITDIRRSAADLGIPWWTITPFAVDDSPAALTQEGVAPDDAGEESADRGRPSFIINAVPAESYRGDTARVLGDVRQWLADQWRVVLVTEGHGPPSGCRNCCAPRGLARTPATLTRRRSRAWPAWPPGWWRPASPGRRCGWRCWPRRTWRASAPAPGRTGGCPAAAVAASTRSSSAPATTSCTSSTASAGTWR